MNSSAIITSEQRIFARKGIRSDRPLNHVRVHLDTAVLKEHGKTGPMSDRIANGLGQIRDLREAANVILQPGVQSLDNGATSLPANPSSLFGGLTADLGFDGVEFADLCQYQAARGDLLETQKL